MSAVYNSTVQGFYLSYYGRPADPAGLTFWTGQLAAAGGNLSAILDAFGTSAEASRRYGTGTNASKIEAIYQQTFGRAADPVGLAFYEGEIAAGRMTLINASKRIIDGAAGDDIPTRANRLSAAQSFTDKLDTDAEKAGYSGTGAEDAARAWVATVTKDAATVTAAVATADATITSLIPQTFNLTTSADKFTGGTGPDTFKGTISALTAATTLQTTDTIDGGSGNDTLDLSLAVGWGGMPTNSVKSIETVSLTNSSAVSVDFRASGITGVTKYVIDATKAPVTLTSVSSGLKTIDLTGQKGGSTAGSSTTFSTAFESGAAESAASATADAIALNLNNVGTSASTSSTGARDVSITLTDFETINLGVTGTNVVRFASGTKITASGEGSLAVEDVAAGLTSFDASAVKGAVAAKFNGTATNVLASVKSGSADDTVTISTAKLTASATLDGGAGTDTLAVTGGNTTVAYRASNFETIALSSISGGALTFAGTNSTGISKVTSASTVESNVTFEDMGSGAITVESVGATADGVTVSSDHSGTATLTFRPSTTAAVAGTSSDNAKGDFTFSKATGIFKINVNANTVVDNNAITATKATSLELNVASKLSATGSELTSIASTIVVPDATSFSVDASGSVNGLTITAVKATSGVISNKGANAVTAFTLADPATAKLESLSIASAEAFVLTNTSDLSALQTLTIDAQKGLTQVGVSALTAVDMTAVQRVTLSGSGTTSAITLGDLGSTNSNNNLSVTASGLKGNLTIASLAIKSGFDLTVDASAVTGSVDLGSSSISGANITINTAGSGGTGKTVTFTGDLTGTGAVRFDAKGASGVTIGTNKTYTGVSVYADLSGTTTTSNEDGLAITARDSATLKLHELDSTSTNKITASSTSTALTIDFTGSVGANTLNIDAGAASTSIVLTGNAGAGSDRVNVDGSLQRASSAGMTIDISGFSGYENSTIYGSARADTIKGGAGADVIYSGTGTDTITTGSGTDVIWFNSGDSTVSSVDTITDLSSSDVIQFSFGTVISPTSNVTGSTTIATVDAALNVATFGLVTAKTELSDKVKALNNALSANQAVYFAHNGETYIFAATDGTDDTTSGVVIKLLGISVPSLSANTFAENGGGGSTGLVGFVA